MIDLAVVSGGAGFIGSHLVDLLITRGYRVRILDSIDEQTHSAGRPSWINRNAELIVGDVRHPGAWARAVKDADVVFHLAALGGFSPASVDYLTVNAVGTALMFDAIREQAPNCRRVVVASSQAVYGEGMYSCPSARCDSVHAQRWAHNLEARRWEPTCSRCGHGLVAIPTPENTPPAPLTMYGVSKLAAERTALVRGRQLDIPTVALRYAVAYGPRQSLSNPYTGVVSIFANRLRQGLPALVYEDGRQTRDFIAVEDLVRANLAASQKSVPAGSYNVGTGRATTVLELVQAVALANDQRATLELLGAYRPGDVRHLFHSTALFRSVVEWQPQLSLSEGLARFAEWFAEQPVVPDRFGGALAKLRAAGVVVGA